MTLKISRDQFFEAAHFLPNVADDHKCKKMHGHSYRCTIELTGKAGMHSGMILDTAEIDKAWSYLHTQLDHQVLNEVEGLENPTTENLVIFIHQKLFKVWGDNASVHKIAVTVRESPRSTAFYDGA